MKECDILWGGQNTLTPPTYFQGESGPPNPQNLCPCPLQLE